VHERDLRRRPTERQKADTRECAKELGETHAAIGHEVGG